MFPKVLLVCGFNQKTANGITIANLFKKWPTVSIALLEYHSDINEIYVSNINKYYLIGDKESRMVFPFNYTQKIRKSSNLVLDSTYKVEFKNSKAGNTLKNKNTVNRIGSFIYGLKLNLLAISGLNYISRQYHISDDLDNWIRNFNPQIIYGTVEDIEKMNFLIELKAKYNKKLAIHVFDDWIHSGHRFPFLRKYWSNKMKNTFNSLIKYSDLCFSISDKMALEYESIYKKPFSAFHNPIDEKSWYLPNLKRDRINGNTFTFVYAGKINSDTAKPILKFILEIEALNNNGFSIDFHIYSPYDKSIIKHYLGAYYNKYYRGIADYKDLPTLFAQADGLLLPLGFQEKTIKYIRLSMLTKVTEYMISGTPIFLYTPDDLAVTEYLTKHNAAFKHSSEYGLKEAIINFIKDEKSRKIISENAQKLALTMHTTDKVTQRLVDILNS